MSAPPSSRCIRGTLGRHKPRKDTPCAQGPGLLSMCASSPYPVTPPRCLHAVNLGFLNGQPLVRQRVLEGADNRRRLSWSPSARPPPLLCGSVFCCTPREHGAECVSRSTLVRRVSSPALRLTAPGADVNVAEDSGGSGPLNRARDNHGRRPRVGDGFHNHVFR